MKNNLHIKMRSIVSLFLAYLMIASLSAGSLFVTQAESVKMDFTDVAKGDWFYSDVQYAYENGIMEGVGNKRFAPGGELSRAMGVTILYRMAGEPDVGNVQHRFNDVKAGAWYSDAVAWGYENGIVKGRSDTEFSPNDKVTRAEFIVFLTRYAYYAEVELPANRTGEFADSMLTPDFAKDAEKLMYESEVLLGQPDNMFLPFASITRAEATALIHRFVLKADKIDPDKYFDIVFVGNSITQTGNTAAHMETLGASKNVKSCAYFEGGNVLKYQYAWFAGELHPYRRIAENAEVVVFQEFAGAYPTVGEDEELNEMWRSESFSNENIVGGFMDLFGREKEYYSYSLFGPTRNGDRNDVMFKVKQILAERYSLDHVYIPNINTFSPDLEISYTELFPDGVHPTNLMGYCIALAMYCEIFDEPAAEQNNGNLTSDDIPGETQAEEDAFMAKLKDTVQAILDIQK